MFYFTPVRTGVKSNIRELDWNVIIKKTKDNFTTVAPSYIKLTQSKS